jgi:hypothetical protein
MYTRKGGSGGGIEAWRLVQSCWATDLKLVEGKRSETGVVCLRYKTSQHPFAKEHLRPCQGHRLPFAAHSGNQCGPVQPAWGFLHFLQHWVHRTGRILPSPTAAHDHFERRAEAAFLAGPAALARNDRLRTLLDPCPSPRLFIPFLRASRAGPGQALRSSPHRNRAAIVPRARTTLVAVFRIASCALRTSLQLPTISSSRGRHRRSCPFRFLLEQRLEGRPELNGGRSGQIAPRRECSPAGRPYAFRRVALPFVKKWQRAWPV